MPPVLSIHYLGGGLLVPNIYWLDAYGNPTVLPSEVDPASQQVSATIAGPGVFVAGVPALAAAAASAPGGSISGLVVLPDGVTGLAGALVQATSASQATLRTTTDSIGAFAFSLPQGSWVVTVDPRANFQAPAAQTVDSASRGPPLLLTVSVPAAAADGTAFGAPEIASLRTAATRTFVVGNGQFETVAYASPVSYRGPDGSWRLINATLTSATVSGYALESGDTGYKVRFTDKPDPLTGNLASVTLANGSSFTIGLPGAAAATRSSAGPAALAYSGVEGGVDLQYTLTSTGVKESIALADASAPASYTFTLTPSGGSAYVVRPRSDGSWAFSSASDPTPLFVLARPTVADGASQLQLGSSRDRVAAGAQGPAALDVQALGDGSFQLKLRLDPQWLHDPGRVFPVLIDPTVTIAPDSVDAVWNTACSSCTPVAGATINVGGTGYNMTSGILFNLGQLPSGNITSSSLSLYWTSCAPLTCGTVQGNGQVGDLGLYQMSAPWSSSTTTAQMAYTTPYLSHTTLNVWSGGNQPNSWVTWTVPTTTIANWLSGASPNYGFALAPAGTTTAFDFVGIGSGNASLAPSLTISWTGDASVLYQPQIVHSNGAELGWGNFPAATGAAFISYEVHRSLTPNFTASTANLVATINDQAVTRYIDTTAALNTAFTYKLVTVTNSGTSPTNPSNEVTVTTPADGLAIATLQPIPNVAFATYLNQASAGTNFGASAVVYAEGASTTLRALLQFDLRALPATATVNAATLSLYSTLIAQTPGSIEVHRVTAAWDENQATWNSRLNGVAWTSAGGDYDATVAATTSAGAAGGTAHWESWTITSLAQNWLNGNYSNYGVLLKLATEVGNTGYDQWNSDDWPYGQALTPKLTITYSDGSHALAPAVSFGAPGAGNTITGTSMQLTAAASDDGAVTKVEFYVDGTLKSTITAGPYNATIDSTTLTRGSHTLLAKAYDNAGNTATSSISVSVANSTPPTVTTPSVSGAGTGTVTISTTASDDRTVSRVEFYVDGTLLGSDSTTPYSLSWNTLASYDGTHAVTVRAFDDDGQSTLSSATNYTATNTVGTKYRAGFAATAAPPEVTYDPSLGTQTTWPIDITLTNNSTITWTSATTVLRYLWYSGDDTPVVTTSSDVALGSDIAAGGNRTIRVYVSAPTLPANVERARYTLRVDLYDSSASQYFAAKGNQPYQQTGTVNLATPLELGLERFQQYDGADLGGGATNEVNLANGNNIVSWTPFSEQGIGLNTVVSITYNSGENGSRSPLGNNVSVSISGLTPLGAPIDVHPNAADTTAGRSGQWIGFLDGDGSYHVFTGQTAGDSTVYWSAPAGVHLYLRQYSTTDTTHWWALTKPDGTTFFFDQQGYPTFVQDSNSNTITYTETAVTAGNDAYGIAKQITAVTDQGGRSVTISYYTASSTSQPALRGKVQTISDHLGHSLGFSYYNDGNLLRITQNGGTNPDGSWQPSRSLVFTYTTADLTGPAIATASARLNPDPTIQQSAKLYSLIDFRSAETTFAYISTAGSTQGRLASRTDRAGSSSSYSYNGSTTIETMPLGRVWSYSFDSQGRVTSISDPVNSRPTTIRWTTDNTVASVSDSAGTYTDYAYNQNGYLTDTWREDTSTLTVSGNEITDARRANGSLFTSSVTLVPATVVDDASYGANAWTNPGNAKLSDNVYATAGSYGVTHYLKATGFGFAIPSNMTIVGIQVNLERRSASNTAGSGRDSSLRLLKGGSVGGTDKADTATLWPTADTVRSYGSSADLWGQTWTPADINSAAFGVALSAYNTFHIVNTVYVDQVTVTVTYGYVAAGGDGRAVPDSSSGIWEGTTNLVTNGGFETNATGWAAWNSAGGGPTLVRDAASAKFGAGSLKVSTVSAGGVNQGAYFDTGNTLAANTTYTFSSWVYNDGSSPLRLRLRELTSAGALIGDTFSATSLVAGAWTYLTVTRAFGATGVRANVVVENTIAVNQNFWVDGAQLEQKSYATPYVETNGLSISRAPGRVQAPSAQLSATQGWVAVSARIGVSDPSIQQTFFAWKGNGGAYLSGTYSQSAGGVSIAQSDGVTPTSKLISVTLAPGSVHTFVFGWDASTLRLSLDGGVFQSVARPLIPSLTDTSIDIGSYNGASQWLDSSVFWLAGGTGALTDADAASLNGNGSTDPALTSLPGNPALLWTASDAVSVSGNEITDATRQAGLQNDGFPAPDSSFGIWEGTTNLVTNGGFETNTSGWTANGSGVVLTRLTGNSMFGSASLQLSGGVGTQRAYATFASGVGIGVTYTVSAWVKAGNAQAIGRTFELTGWDAVGATGTAVGVPLTTAWQRVRATFTTTNGTGAIQVYGGSLAQAVAGDLYLVDGVQAEQKSYATPYVETNGLSISRAPGRVQAPSAQLSATQGWVAVSARIGVSDPSIQQTFFAWKGNGGAYLSGTYSQSAGGVSIAQSDGVTPTSKLISVTLAPGSVHTFVFGWDASTLRLSLDGGVFQSVARPLIPSLTDTSIDIGSYNGASQWLDSSVFWLAGGTGALTDADAASLNGNGSTDPALTSLPGNPALLWTANIASGYTKAADHTALSYQNVTVDANDVTGKWQTGRSIPHISQLVSKTDPAGNATSVANDYRTLFGNDVHGNVLTVTDPLGNVTTLTYNSNGTLASQTLPNNGDSITRTTVYNTYDANGLPTQVSDAAGGVTRVSYDAAGNTLSLQDPNHGSFSGGTSANYQTQSVYDLFGRLIRSSTPKSTQFASGLLIWTDTVYDANDNVVSAMNAHYGVGDSQGAPVTSTLYDAMDRPTLVTTPDTVGGLKQTQTDYDAAGRAIKVTSPNGVASTSISNDYAVSAVYDLLGRVASTTAYYSDGNGNLNSSQNRTTNYCYDLAGDLRSVTGPEGTASFSGCPAVSSPATYTYTNAPDTTKYVYAAAHRRTQQTDALGNTSSTAYDENGHTTLTTDENGNTTSYSYDARGQQTKVVQPFDLSSGHTVTTIHQYDALGNVSALISPRAYDSSADKQTFTNYVTSYSYDALNRQTKTSILGGTVSYLTTVTQDGPLAYWRLGEASGTTAADQTGNTANNGSYAGAYTLGQTGAITGSSSTSVAFSGGQVTANVSSVPTAPGTQVTVEFWMNWNGTDNVIPFSFNNGGWYDLFFNSGRFGFNCGCGDLVGISSSGLANSWHLVDAVFTNGGNGSQSSNKLYIDGTQQTLTGSYGSCNTAPYPSAGSAVWIGAAPSAGYAFNGRLDEVALYASALNDLQISAHYTTGTGQPIGRAYLHTAYDANGNTLWTSLPTSQSTAANVAPADKTSSQYWDTGAIYSTTAPTVPELRYDYSAEGRQTASLPETAIGSGSLDYSRMQLWAYLADGKLQAHTDQAGLRDSYSYDLDGNKVSITEALGAGNPSTALPVTITVSYDGFDQLTKVRIPEDGNTNSYDGAVLSSSGFAPQNYWKFDNNGLDSQPAGNNLSVSGGNYTCVPGIASSSACYQSNSGTSATAGGSVGSYTGQSSFEFWTSATAQDQSNSVWVAANTSQGVDSGWLVKFNGGQLLFQQGIGTSSETQVQTQNTLATSSWHQVDVTENSTCTNAHIYVDGVETGYSIYKMYGCAPAPTGGVRFGGYSGTDSLYFDNAAWFNSYQLSATDVANHYNARSLPTTYNWSTALYWSTTFAYDQHGNVTQLVQNQEEHGDGSIVTAGRTETYTYNYLDQPTLQTDNFGTPANANDDEQIAYSYTAVGLEASQATSKANGSGGWTAEQAVSNTYYANGLQKTLVTTDGGSPVTTISQHTLAYLDSNSIYVDGNKTSDVFQLHGPDPSAPCYSSTCTATWTYDPQDRLRSENNGTGTTTTYQLDIYGNSTKETQVAASSVTIARTATYNGVQLQTDTAAGVTKKYIYDSVGNLNCVVTNAWGGAGCPSITGTIDPSLLTYNIFDTKNRLIGIRTYNNGALIDAEDFVPDALDRTLAQTETTNGVTTRTDFIYIGLSTAVGQEKLTNSNGTLTETKGYAYDALGRRATLNDAPVGGTPTRYSYVYDPHGSVEALVDQNRSLQASYSYTAYGTQIDLLTKTAGTCGQAGAFCPNTNLYRYEGNRYDTGSKTIDMGARRYSPSIERFIQRDSYFAALNNLGLSTDPLNGNRYALAGANPINFVDHDGHIIMGTLLDGASPGYWARMAASSTQTQTTTTAPPTAGPTPPTSTPFAASPETAPKTPFCGQDRLSCTPDDFAAASWDQRSSWINGVQNRYQLGGWLNVFTGIVGYFRDSQVFSNSPRMRLADGLVLWAVESGLSAAYKGTAGGGPWTPFFTALFRQGPGDVRISDRYLKSLWGSAELTGVRFGEDYVNAAGIPYQSNKEAFLEPLFLTFGDEYRNAVRSGKTLKSRFGIGLAGDPRRDAEGVRWYSNRMEGALLAMCGVTAEFGLGC